MRSRPVAAVAAAVAAAGCHVVTREPITRPGEIARTAHREGAIARRPVLALAGAGALRFVEPLECPSEEDVASITSYEVVTRPNLAAFVVGSIAGAVGAIMLVRGLAGEDPGGDPITYAGATALAAGAPLAIGPWFGNGRELSAPTENPRTRRPGPSVPCGDRPLAARAATLTVRGVEVRGAIDRDGVFAVPLFQLIDAFDAATAGALEITAQIDADAGPRTLSVVFEADALARHAAAFLAGAELDAAIEPIRLVPGVSAGALRVELTAIAGGRALRITLPVKNDGPGPAWALRGHLIAPGLPAIDGRILYFGALARGAALARELVIPVSDAAAAALARAPIELSIELRDAHGTAPVTPIRFRGAVVDGR